MPNCRHINEQLILQCFSHFLCFTLFCPPEIPASGFDYINFSVLYFHISLDMLCFLPWSPLFKLEVIEMQRNVVSLLELDEEEQGKKYFHLPNQSNRVISLKFRLFFIWPFSFIWHRKAKDNARTSFFVDPNSRVNYDDSKVVFNHLMSIFSYCNIPKNPESIFEWSDHHPTQQVSPQQSLERLTF